jgi:hypothetical protein
VEFVSKKLTLEFGLALVAGALLLLEKNGGLEDFPENTE